MPGSSDETQAPATVTQEDRARASLLAHVLEGVLERGAATAQGRQKLRALQGRVLVEAAGMKVTLDFDGQGTAVIRPGEAGPAAARIAGSLGALARLCLGGGVVWPLISGRLRIRGRIRLLLKLRGLLRVV